MLKATLCPSPIVPSTFSTGTGTLSSMSAVVDEPSSPSFRSSDPLTTPMRSFDQERREPLAVHLGEDGEEIGEAAVGDPDLLAVEHVVPAIRRQPRRRARGQRVGAGSGSVSAYAPISSALASRGR